MVPVRPLMIALCVSTLFTISYCESTPSVDVVLPESVLTESVEDDFRPGGLRVAGMKAPIQMNKVEVETSDSLTRTSKYPVIRPSAEELLEAEERAKLCPPPPVIGGRRRWNAVKVKNLDAWKKVKATKTKKLNLDPLTCKFEREVDHGCAITLKIVVTTKDSTVKAYNNACCEAGLGYCTGIFAKTEFDIDVTVGGKCTKGFDYEESREIVLASSNGIEAILTPTFTLSFEAGLYGDVTATFPGTVTIRPPWSYKASDAKIGSPTIKGSQMKAAVTLSAELAVSLEVSALKVVSAGFAASLKLKGTDTLEIAKDGSLTKKSKPTAKVTATCKVDFVYTLLSLKFSIPNLDTCSAGIDGFKLNLDSGLGGSKNLFKKEVTLYEG